MKRVIVVGSGIAGLIAALELSKGFEVLLITKSELAESNTRWAQGGIAAAMFEDDSMAEHVEDTLRAGAGLCDRAAVEVLCSEGPDRIRDLIRLGVDFDRKDGELDRGLEAAHSRARVLHAGGDSTGLSIETALVRAVRASSVQVMEHTFACDLLLDRDRCTGLEVLCADGEHQYLLAEAVILACGGAGQLYLHTTNPLIATGDGVAMALRAGAELADLEFYQFHPTALAMPGSFLISEAVRGEGALLLDANGRRFMPSVHQMAELAPRDVVARAIAMQMAQQDGKPVLLDATALSADFLKSRFPTIDKACRALGLDWSTDPIPVTPAAHYWMGGVRTDLWGQTSLHGLFAVGEVACTGVHGANRLASNSLLESLVFAWRCAHRLLEQGLPAAASWVGPGGHNDVTMDQPDDEPSGREPCCRKDIQRLMWDAAGIERTSAELSCAADRLRTWQSNGESVEQRETANLLCLARVLVVAALNRRESRGAHFRTDYAETCDAMRHSLVVARKVAASC